MVGKRVEFLYLSEPDMINAGVLDMTNCVNVIDEVFKLLSQGDYLMGGPKENSHGTMLWFPKEQRTENMPVAGPDRRFMAMIAYLGGRFNVCGEKWYGSNVNNKKYGLPRSILNIVLNDKESGAPLAFASGNLVSSMRTGAVPGVATKYLQAEGASVIGIIGAGVISRACLLAIAETLKNKKEVKVYDINRNASNAFCNEMKNLIKIDVHPVETLEEAIKDSDIVSVATSGAASAFIKDEWIKEGAVIEMTGTAVLSESCYINSKIVIDNWKMHKEWIDEGYNHPDGIESIMSWAPSAPLLKLFLDGKKKEEDIVSLGDIATGKEKGRTDNKEKIIFVTGGMPVEDVAWAYTIYKQALEKGIGQKLCLWDEPHWF